MGTQNPHELQPLTPKGRPRWLTRNLKVVSGVSFLQDAASEMLYPVLPIFLSVVLGAPAAVVGAVEGVAEGAAAVTKVVSGRLSDRYRRVRLIGVGYGLAALGKLLVAAATVWPVVLAGRCVDRLGKGIRGAPRDALIAVDVAPEARGRAFGFHRALDTAGAVAGPLAGLALYQVLGGQIRPLLVIAVVPAIASVVLVAALRDPGHDPHRAGRSGAAGPSDAVAGQRRRLADLPSRYWRVVSMLAAFSVINFPDALLLLRLHDIGFSVSAVHRSPAAMARRRPAACPSIGAYVTYNAVYALFSYPAGALADRAPPAAVFGLGLVFFSLTYAGLGVTDNHVVAWSLIGGYGVYTACTDGVGKAWISGLLPTAAQGTGQGLFQGVTGIGVLVAGVWAGLLWGADGTTPLLISGTCAAVFAIAFLVIGAVRRPSGSRPSPT